MFTIVMISLLIGFIVGLLVGAWIYESDIKRTARLQKYADDLWRRR